MLAAGQLLPDDHTMGSDVQRFFKRIDWGSGGKSFIECTGGYVGVAPRSTKAGDEVFVVVGCQQPLVLRRQVGGGGHRYAVVGECYVEGCARGEPLVGRLADEVGFMLKPSPTRAGLSRVFRNLQTGDVSREDPRLVRLGVDLGRFRAQLADDCDDMLRVAPEELMARIDGLKKIDLV